MKKFTFLFSILFFSFFLSAQKQSDKWYFGNGGALDFSTGTPSVIASGMAGYAPSEGCSVISDATGNLLFYTDGITVVNKTHTQMANGNGLMGGISSTQAALIVPQPAANGIYYIFTTDDFGGVNGFRYSIVDMNLASGNGSVTVKNASLIGTVSEKITAVKDPNSNRFWVLAHEFNSASFYAYSLSSTGLSAPVISNIGAVHGGTLQNTYGQMKFNPCGNKVALTIGYTDLWEYFNFNTNTGFLSNVMSFPMSAHVYGIEFSPDASKLYVSTYDPFKTLVQYDVSSNVLSTIAVSQLSLSTTTDIYGLQLANDGKVYVCKSFSQFVGVVNSPNVAGAACNYQDFQIDLDPSFMGITAALGLPGFPQSYFMPSSFTCPVVLGVNEIKVLDKPIVIYPNPSADDFNVIIEEQTTLKVYNYTGQQIELINVMKPRTISIGENYPAGIYFVKAENKGRTTTTKIIKK